MKKLLSSLLFAITACISLPASAQPSAAKPILVLAPQGVDPARDTLGYNDLVKNVTRAFAADLEDVLRKKGRAPIDVLDQSPGKPVGDKLALHTVRNAVDTAIVVTLEPEDVGEDRRINLMVQYVEGRFYDEAGKVAGYKAAWTLRRVYLLKSSVTGNSTKTFLDLAEDFVGELQKEGRP